MALDELFQPLCRGASVVWFVNYDTGLTETKQKDENARSVLGRAEELKFDGSVSPWQV